MLRDTKGREVIVESDSPWFLHVVLIRKKNQDLQFYVDYRRLNDITKIDCFPLRRATLDTLAGSKWFSTLDLKSECWQVALHPSDTGNTAFYT
jgi:hypothetical protein